METTQFTEAQIVSILRQHEKSVMATDNDQTKFFCVKQAFAKDN